MANRRRWLVLTAGAAATILVVAGVVLATRRDSSRRHLSLVGAAAGDPASSVPASSAPTTPGQDANTSSTGSTGSTGVSSVGTTSPTTTATSSVTNPTTTAGPPTPGPLVINDGDNGQSFVVHKGQEIDVQLSAQSIYTWSEPASTDEMVVHRTGGSGGDAANATFTAAAVGKADINARHDPKCYPQCKAPSFLFVVHITVIL